MTKITTNKPRFIDGVYQVSQEDALQNLLKIVTKIEEFNQLSTRNGNIEKISEILNMVNEQMLDIIVYDSDSIYYGLMFNVVTVLNYYKDNKHLYDNQPEEVVSKFKKLLDVSTGMVMLYLKNHYNRVDNETMLEEQFDILIN
jgi:hypothetical protein